MLVGGLVEVGGGWVKVSIGGIGVGVSVPGRGVSPGDVVRVLPGSGVEPDSLHPMIRRLSKTRVIVIDDKGILFMIDFQTYALRIRFKMDFFILV